MRRAGAAIGADARVTVRALVCLAVLGIAASTGPFPYPQVAAVALVVLCLDWARRKQ